MKFIKINICALLLIWAQWQKKKERERIVLLYKMSGSVTPFDVDIFINENNINNLLYINIYSLKQMTLIICGDCLQRKRDSTRFSCHHSIVWVSNKLVDWETLMMEHNWPYAFSAICVWINFAPLEDGLVSQKISSFVWRLWIVDITSCIIRVV